MKTALLSVLFILSQSALAAPKTCEAFLGGKLKKENLLLPAPYIFYPKDSWSKPAKWSMDAQALKLINPPSIKIECGKPFFYGAFEPLTAAGVLPQAILTDPWVTTGYDGKPRVIEATTMYGFGSSYDYPYPEINFENSTPTIINAVLPAGTKDVCDLSRIDLPTDLTFHTQISLPPTGMDHYALPSEYGNYRWDNSKVPAWPSVELTVIDPYITLSCDKVFSFEGTFQWPYEFDQMDGLCKGSVDRQMTMEGTFFVEDENKVHGFLHVKKPTVTSTGAVSAYFSGNDFDIELDGFIRTTEEGKKVVDLAYFDGGDGISWNYTLSCFGATQKYSWFAAAREFLKVMQEDEIWSDINPGYITFDLENDEKDYDVDKGGQGTAHVHRVWKKLY